MTREEAIIEMQRMKKAYCNTHTDAQLKKDSKIIDALDIGIKALEQQPCEDAISREQAVSDYADWYGFGYSDTTFYRSLKNMPSVTPKQKVGRWEYVRYEGYCGNWHCSECRTIIPHMPEETDNTPIYKWCPMCGAKMKEMEK